MESMEYIALVESFITFLNFQKVTFTLHIKFTLFDSRFFNDIPRM